jgi:nucleoside-diphosphate-sugar epimerase
MNSKRILVAGVASFLDSHLCDLLPGEANHIIGVDSLSTGGEVNLVHLSNESRFEIIERNICIVTLSCKCLIFL